MIDNVVLLTQIAGGVALYFWILAAYAEIPSIIKLVRHRFRNCDRLKEYVVEFLEMRRLRRLKCGAGYWSGLKEPVCEIYAPTGEVSPLHDPSQPRKRRTGLFKVYASIWRIGKWAVVLQIMLISKCFLFWNPNSWLSAGAFAVLVLVTSISCVIFSRGLLFASPFVEFILTKGAALDDISEIPLDDRRACFGIIKVRRGLCQGLFMIGVGSALLIGLWIFPGDEDSQMSRSMKTPMEGPVTKENAEALGPNAVKFFKNLGGKLEPWNQKRRGIALATLRTKEGYELVAATPAGKSFQLPDGQSLAGILKHPSLGDRLTIPELKARFPNVILYVGTISDLEAVAKTSRIERIVFTAVAAFLLIVGVSGRRRMKIWLKGTLTRLSKK